MCVCLCLCGLLYLDQPCHAFQYQCEDGDCYSVNGRCDGAPDCIDGSDEFNCSAYSKI